VGSYYRLALFIVRLVACGFIVWGAFNALFVIAAAILTHGEAALAFMIWNPILVHELLGVVLWFLAPLFARKISAGLD